MQHKGITTIVVAIALSVTPIVWAQEDQAAQFKQRLEDTKARLTLSDEQVEQITPILEASFEARRAILAKYGIDLENRAGPSEKLSFRQRRSLRKDMGKVHEDTLGELSTILSNEHLEEYKKIQKERADQMRERLKEAKKNR